MSAEIDTEHIRTVTTFVEEGIDWQRQVWDLCDEVDRLRAVLAALLAPPPDRVPEGPRCEGEVMDHEGLMWQLILHSRPHEHPRLYRIVPARLVPVSQDTEGEQP